MNRLHNLASSCKLMLLLACPLAAWADNASSTAGSENWVVTGNNIDNTQSGTELGFNVTANVTVLIGAGEIWEARAVTIDNASSSTTTISAEGSPQFVLATYDDSNGKTRQVVKDKFYDTDSKKYLLPNDGNYCKVQFHTSGVVTLNLAFKGSSSDETKLWIAEADGESVSVSKTANGTTYTATAPTAKIFSGATQLTDASSGTTISPKDASTPANAYYPITGNGTDKTSSCKGYTLQLSVTAGQEVYVMAEKTEELSIGSLTFKVDNAHIFQAAGTPYVHKQLERGKDISAQGGDATLTGVEHLTFMYGGWCSHPNAVKAATWNASGSQWGFSDNGTANTQYTAGSEQKTDQWAAVATETALTTLDGYTAYISGCGNPPLDELGNAYAVPSTAKASAVPCRGTYYKFEPQRDGHLAVYVRQAATQPLYFVDEGGLPLTTISTSVSRGYYAGQADAAITPTGSGYVSDKLTAARYTFALKAGKTYVLFQSGAELGLYGFTFGTDATSATTLKLSDSEDASLASAANCTVTLSRKLRAHTWNALVLPFSMTEAQVRAAFGDGAVVAEYEGVSSGQVKFLTHYYQVITAGKPVVLIPGEVAGDHSYTISGVTVSPTTSLLSQEAGGWAFTGLYEKATMAEGSYFIGYKSGDDSSAALLYYVGAAAGKSIGTLRAYFRNTSGDSSAKLMGMGLDDDADGTTTAIASLAGQSAAQPRAIFTLQGQYVGADAASLPAGVYIISGKKVYVK